MTQIFFFLVCVLFIIQQEYLCVLPIFFFNPAVNELDPFGDLTDLEEYNEVRFL